MFLTILIIYLVGAFLTFCAEAYFEGEYRDDPGPLIAITLLWFLITPLVGVEKLYNTLANAGERRRKRVKEQERIRIAEEQEKEKFLQEAEKETESFVEELHSKRR
jgi:hypothetical protein